ncbi:hypothetical protein BDV96DRAFT_403516 [Lophiotrema nucula]|uniref:BTB domain-containing protein n=1 Tax=Lophiotrema nucula TaxID=690887 RepID=A0A6A5ZHE2_9PLEO|nr:hypothetical protein BDV96DRAFT_403516 [Lophiotrema nucula]
MVQPVQNSSATLVRPSEAAQLGLIVVKIGAEGKLYLLHDSLMQQHSSFFRKAKEIVLGMIDLTSYDAAIFDTNTSLVDTFDIFVNWVYTQKVLARSGQWRSATVGFKPDPSSNDAPMYHAYVLADMLLAPNFKSAILDQLFAFLRNSSPKVEDVAYCFKHLPSDDPLLRLLVDSACKFGHVMGFFQLNEKDMEILPRAFFYRANKKLVGQMNGLWSRGEAGRAEWLERCNYSLARVETTSGSYDRKKSRGGKKHNKKWESKQGATP